MANISRMNAHNYYIGGRDNYLFAHFINHAPKGTANCIFVKGGLLVTSRAIDKGEEFFVDYGDSFVGVS